MRTEGGSGTKLGTILVNGALAFVCLAAVWIPVAAFAQTPPPDSNQRDALQQQLDALEREAAELDQHIETVQEEAKTLQREISLLESEIKRRELEIRRLTVAIQQANLDIQAKTDAIEILSQRIKKNRTILGRNILQIHAYDQEQMLVVLAKNETLSDFFSTFDSIRTVQNEVHELVIELRDTRTQFEEEKSELEEFRQQQLSLRALSEIERRAVVTKRAERDRLLKLTRGKEAEFQRLFAEKQKDIAALRTQLFYLERTGITAEEALKYADLAAKRAGIRTAFLLALLEVETGRQFEGGVITAGTNLGSGNWKADMSPRQHTAFIQITTELGFDPDQMPVSARPCAKATREAIGPGKPCGYGWGGAMGPAQFIPTTWLLFKNKVAALTGHDPPNPWTVEDAFTASAIFLSEAGAGSQQRAGEIAAARTYISGRPNCPASGAARSACIAYANRVVSLAADIERVI